MTVILSLIVLGLRGGYFAASVLALFAYAGPAMFAVRQIWRRAQPAPEDVLPLAFWLGAIGGVAFVGKRVVLAVVLHQAIVFDRGFADAAGTAVGLLLLTLSNFLPAWAKARYAGNEQYGRYGAGVIAASGTAFALVYGLMHKMI